jgi:hypothetical protein
VKFPISEMPLNHPFGVLAAPGTNELVVVPFRAADIDVFLAALVVSFKITVSVSPTFLARRSSNKGR